MVQSAKIFTLPASQPFLKTLAQGLLNRYGEDGALAAVKIWLPTRRACRNLRDVFLDLTQRDALILPEMRPLGESDPSELVFQSALYGLNIEDIPPAISPAERELLLTRLILQVPRFSGNTPQALSMARSLAQLLDQVYTENLDLNALETIVPETLAENWKVSLAFLDILRQHWPAILTERGVIDPADRRARLMRATLELLAKAPLQSHVIAAGSTGSIPLTADLLGAISRLPKGEVILPGFDIHMDSLSWDAIAEGHPHYTMKSLLQRIHVQYDDVSYWPDAPALTTEQKARESLWREVMRPAETSQLWTQKSSNLDQAAVKGLHLVAADTPEEEAHVIALALREVLSDPDTRKTAALVTPDRTLALRVHAQMRRWGITLDDSAGKPLSKTLLGDFFLKVLHTVRDGFHPISLISLLQHPYTHFGMKGGEISDLTMRLSRQSGFRGFWSDHHLQRLLNNDVDERSRLPEDLNAFLRQIVEMLTPLRTLLTETPDIDLKTLMEAHLRLAETIADGPDMEGKARLWREEAGEEAANFFADLLENLQDFRTHFTESVSALYGAFLKSQMDSLTVRPAYGTHPRLAILGQLEARLMQTDLLILGSLNEGSWPALPEADPWMSRPMRAQFGLPAAERSITLSAHDFVQGASAKTVLLTRSLKADGIQTVPARWLQRLHIFLETAQLSLDEEKTAHLLGWARQMHRDETSRGTILDAPYPIPPLDKRPKHFSASSLELLMRDPYGLYAKSVLKLRPLDPYEEEAGPRERGNFIHTVAAQFCMTFPEDLPENAEEVFLKIAEDIFEVQYHDPALHAAWWPRIEQLAKAFTAWEREWREKGYRFARSETKGELQQPPYSFEATADRIDRCADGSYAIIDYKTGSAGNYSEKGVQNGFLSQLPLEGIILKGSPAQPDVFKGLPKGETSYMGYWILGHSKIFEEKNVAKKSPEDIVTQTHLKIEELLKAYEDPKRGYPSQPFSGQEPSYSQYDHLARLQEWRTSGDTHEGDDA